MVTNFYLCQRLENLQYDSLRIHVGKSSAGSTFRFRGYPPPAEELPWPVHITSRRAWIRVFETHAQDQTLYDEYGYAVPDKIQWLKKLKRPGPMQLAKELKIEADHPLPVADYPSWRDQEGFRFNNYWFS